MTTREVAHIAGVTPNTVRYWVKTKRLPCEFTDGGRSNRGKRRFRRDEIIRLLSDRTVFAKADSGGYFLVELTYGGKLGTEIDRPRLEELKGRQANE